MSKPDWAAEVEAMAAIRAQLDLANRASLFEALEDAGVTTVAVEFDGYGDEGNIGTVVFHRDDQPIAAPATFVKFLRQYAIHGPPAPEMLSIVAAVEDVAYLLLGTCQLGWQDNDGSYGDFEFDVATRSIALDFNARFTDAVNYSYEF